MEKYKIKDMFKNVYQIADDLLADTLLDIFETEQDVTYFIEKTQWCFLQHNITNHYYDHKPYSKHLNDVFRIGLENLNSVFSSKINNQDKINILFGCLSHDLIEDTRNTYNDVADKLGVDVADIAYKLTNEKGKNRAERANDKYYSEIRENEFAIYVKLCDRIANIEYSKNSGSSMYKKYIKEMPNFLEKLVKGNNIYNLQHMVNILNQYK